MSWQTAASISAGAIVGAFGWTATEYATHRWILHGPFGKGRLNRVPLGGLHRAHHRDPLCTSLAMRAAGHVAVAAAAGAAAMVAGAVATGLPALAARGAAATWSAGYSTYEIMHWNAHHRPARTAWGVALRARHHRHHYGAPRANMGVTTAFWDSVFGTEAPPIAAG